MDAPPSLLKRLTDALFGARRKAASPTRWMGSPGFAAYSGYVDLGERDRNLADHDERFRTYSSILINISIVAASVRYYLNLASRVAWRYEPAEADRDAMFAERIEAALMRPALRTPWHGVVRRAAMYRLFGFSTQEWLAGRGKDGWLVMRRIRPRPAHTIERWDVDMESGDVLGVVQQRPQDSAYLYIPRAKLLYTVDDALSDNPEGIGLLRHLVSPIERLRRYEQLEGFGFETDLRNIPIGRAPFSELAAAVESGEITQADANAKLKAINDFIRHHVKTPQLGLTMDSSVYQSEEEGRPSSVPKFALDLLSGTQTSLSDMGGAIERLNHEIARVLGTDQLLLGAQNVGSFALSKDKTSQFYSIVEGALTEIREAVQSDIVERLFELNGWPMELQPVVRTESVRPTDVEEVVMGLREIATAGAPIEPDDPAINQVRDLMGIEHAPEMSDMDKLVRTMADDPDDDPDDEDDMPPGDGS